MPLYGLAVIAKYLSWTMKRVVHTKYCMNYRAFSTTDLDLCFEGLVEEAKRMGQANELLL